MGPNSALARKFFDSVQAGDGEAVRSICAPDMEVKRNGVPDSAESVLAIASTIKKALPDFRYEDVVCVDTENGFVEEHVGRLTHPAGHEVEGVAVVVGIVNDGRIVSMQEYMDPAVEVQVREAVQAAMAR